MSLNAYRLIKEVNKEFEEGKKIKGYRQYSLRRIFANKYSWAVPCIPIIRIIGWFFGSSKVMEVGAGTGLWTYLLHEFCGTRIIATDVPSHFNNNMNNHTFCKIYPDGTPNLVSRLNPDGLFCCWPPYSNSFAYDCLKNFTGNKFVYIGETDYGCTGDDKFHQLLRDEWVGNRIPIPIDLVNGLEEDIREYIGMGDVIYEDYCINMRSWDDLHDYLFLYVRKNPILKHRSYRDVLLGTN